MRPSSWSSWSALVVLVVGCGGGATDPPGPPPPPPPAAGPPAAIAIRAGDAQQVGIARPVPVRPSVRVTDAASRPVPSVAVTFAVTAGGGSVAVPAATTGSDGVATSGDWSLGPDEGENTLTATVAGLPPVVFRAVGTPAPRTLADSAAGPGGTTIAVSDPGRPADGVRVVIPSGALATPTHVSVTVLPAPVLALPNGVSLVGPVLEIAGLPDAQLGSLVTLTLPVPVVPGAAVAAFLRHPETGRLEVLTPVARDAATLTVVTRHLSPNQMLGSGPLGLSAANRFRAEATAVQIVLLEALMSRLNEGIETGFRPGVDDWEFTNFGSYLAPGGHCAGQSITAMWYYLRMKPTLGPLNRSLDRIAAFWPDNPGGYRFASVVQEVLDWEAQVEVFKAIKVTTAVVGLSGDALHFQTASLAMLATGEPQFLAIHGADGGHAIVAWGARADGLLIADPNYPGVTRNVEFTSAGFTPYPSQPKSGDPGALYPTIRVAGTTTMMATSRLDALWPTVLDRTVGADLFPQYSLEYFDLLADAWKPLPAAITLRQDEIRVRAPCAACGSGMHGAPERYQWLIGYDAAGRELGNGSTPAGQTPDGMTMPLEEGTRELGLYVIGAPDNQTWAFLDWRWIEVTAARFGLEPDSADVGVEQNVPFIARPYGNHPASAKYRWDFGDDTPPVSTTDSVTGHAYAEAGSYVATVEMFDPETDQLLARARSPVLVQDSLTTWRLTSFTGAAPPWQAVAVSPRGAYEDDDELFSRFRANPAAVVLFYRSNPVGLGPSVSMQLVPPPPGTRFSAGLGTMSDDGSCEPNFVIWTGSPSTGTIESAHTRSCIAGLPAAISNVRLALHATKAGDEITGTITATYQDYVKRDGVVNGKQVRFLDPLETKVVTYQFKGVRQ